MASQDQATLSPPFLLHHASGADTTISSSFPILLISIVGMLTTAILLLSYYIFVTKCLFPSSSNSGTNDDDDRLRLAYYSNNTGLDKSVFRALPTLRFRNTAGWLSNYSRHYCAVCQNEFEEEDIIRMLPSCYHAFHIDCIDTWLQTHSNCPLCRADLTTTTTTGYPNFRPSSGDQSVVAIDDRADQETESGGKKEKSKCRVGVSVGDECVGLREKDKEYFNMMQEQPLRRSFSMDSSGDRQLYVAVQEILQQNPHFRRPEGRHGGSFFSFSR